MELTQVESDLKIYLGRFDGFMIRFFADKHSEEIYCNIEDLETVLSCQPEGTNFKDYQELKAALLKTMNTNIFNLKNPTS